MKHGKKVEIIYVKDSLVPIGVGFSLGTVYSPDPVDVGTYRLQNFGYCPSYGFYFNKNVHLPKNIIDYFESASWPNKKIEAEMKAHGLYDSQDIQKAISKCTSIPISKLISEETEMLLDLNGSLKGEYEQPLVDADELTSLVKEAVKSDNANADLMSVYLDENGELKSTGPRLVKKKKD